MALNSLLCAHVPLRNCSLTHFHYSFRHWHSHRWARAHPTSARVGREICTNLKSFFRGVGWGIANSAWAWRYTVYLLWTPRKCVCPLQIVYAYLADPLCPPYLQTLAMLMVSDDGNVSSSWSLADRLSRTWLCLSNLDACLALDNISLYNCEIFGILWQLWRCDDKRVITALQFSTGHRLALW